MLNHVEVWYEGWGERWLWGTLASTTVLAGRPQIMFEYSQQAWEKGQHEAGLLKRRCRSLISDRQLHAAERLCR
jgi:hypothetical protein